MKGHAWDGSEYNWVHNPTHYGAMHFHDDDLYDCGWETDFTFTVPEALPSGLYCAHLTQDGHEDYVPFVVRPPRGTARAPLALLLPTASYWAYANRHVRSNGASAKMSSAILPWSIPRPVPARASRVRCLYV